MTVEHHLSEELMSRSSVINEDGDVAAYGFWGGRFEKAFMNVRVFNPSAQSNRRGPLASVYRRHELEKKTSVRSESKRSRTCHLHIPCDVSHWRNGQIRHNLLQKVCLNDQRKEEHYMYIIL